MKIGFHDLNGDRSPKDRFCLYRGSGGGCAAYKQDLCVLPQNHNCLSAQKMDGFPLSLGSRIEQMLSGDNSRNKSVLTEGEESENKAGGGGLSDGEEPC